MTHVTGPQQLPLQRHYRQQINGMAAIMRTYHPFVILSIAIVRDNRCCFEFLEQSPCTLAVHEFASELHHSTVLTERGSDCSFEAHGPRNVRIVHVGPPTLLLKLGTAKMSADDVDTYGDVVPWYIGFSIVSVLATSLVTLVSTSSARIRSDHYSIMIQIITTCDLLYTLKFLVSAMAWVAGRTDARSSFHLFGDDCMSAAAYGIFTGLACISWNAAWIFDFLCVLVNPLRNTAAQRRWYHVCIWSLCVFATVWTLAVGGHGNSDDHTCLVRGTDSSSLVFEIPLFAYLLLAVISLIFAAVRLSSGTRTTKMLRRRLLTRHATYVIAFVMLWLWPLLYAFLDNGKNDKAQEPLAIMDAVAVSGQAAVFAAIRLAEPGAWSILKRLLKHYWAELQSTCELVSSCFVVCCPRVCVGQGGSGSGGKQVCCCRRGASGSGGGGGDGRLDAVGLNSSSGNSAGNGGAVEWGGSDTGPAHHHIRPIEGSSATIIGQAKREARRNEYALHSADDEDRLLGHHSRESHAHILGSRRNANGSGGNCNNSAMVRSGGDSLGDYQPLGLANSNGSNSNSGVDLSGSDAPTASMSPSKGAIFGYGVSSRLQLDLLAGASGRSDRTGSAAGLLAHAHDASTDVSSSASSAAYAGNGSGGGAGGDHNRPALSLYQQLKAAVALATGRSSDASSSSSYQRNGNRFNGIAESISSVEGGGDRTGSGNGNTYSAPLLANEHDAYLPEQQHHGGGPNSAGRPMSVSRQSSQLPATPAGAAASPSKLIQPAISSFALSSMTPAMPRQSSQLLLQGQGQQQPQPSPMAQSASSPPPASSSGRNSAGNNNSNNNNGNNNSKSNDNGGIREEDQGFDLAAGLRQEMGLAMLSALVHAVAASDGEALKPSTHPVALGSVGKRGVSTGTAGYSGGGEVTPALPSPLSSASASTTELTSVGDLGGAFSSVGSAMMAMMGPVSPAVVVQSPSAPDEFRSISAWQKDKTTVIRRVPMITTITASPPPSVSSSSSSIAPSSSSASLAAAGSTSMGLWPAGVHAHSSSSTPSTAAPSSGSGHFSSTSGIAGSHNHNHNQHHHGSHFAPEGSVEVTSFGDAQFSALRLAAGLTSSEITANFHPSLLLAGKLKAHFSDGASSSFFCRSADGGSLIVKTIAASECEVLLRLLPAYARHLVSNPASLLARIYGCYGIRLPSSGVGSVYFVVMGNVFPISEPGPSALVFDLKGSTVNRRARVSKTNQAGSGSGSGGDGGDGKTSVAGVISSVLAGNAAAAATDFNQSPAAGAAGSAGNSALGNNSSNSSGDSKSVAASSSSASAAAAAAKPRGLLYQDLEFREAIPYGLPVVDSTTMLAVQEARQAAAAAAEEEEARAAAIALLGGSTGGTNSSSYNASSGGTGNTYAATVPIGMGNPALLDSAAAALAASAGSAAAVSHDQYPDLRAGRGRARAVVDQLQRDVTLLASQGLMDYSLLLQMVPVDDNADDEEEEEDYNEDDEDGSEGEGGDDGDDEREGEYEGDDDDGGGGGDGQDGDEAADRTANCETSSAPTSAPRVAIEDGGDDDNSEREPTLPTDTDASGRRASPDRQQQQLAQQQQQQTHLSFHSARAIGPHTAASLLQAVADLPSHHKHGHRGDQHQQHQQQHNQGAASMPASSPSSGSAFSAASASAVTRFSPLSVHVCALGTPLMSSAPLTSTPEGGHTQSAPPPSPYSKRVLVQLGLIDLFQFFGTGKKLENAFKAVRYGDGKVDVSAVDPARYAVRFMAFAANIFMPDEGGSSSSGGSGGHGGGRLQQ